ncbi:MAG: hypothetical protein ABSA46_13820 [Thermodesulfovibrionales bacterium]|jgi:lauroyl/myristoyl acyltransferase
MIATQELRRWRYYFIDLPLWAYGIRTTSVEKRLFSFFKPEIPSFRDGIITLCNYLGRSATESEIEDIIQKAFRVKIVRESDAYTCLRMSKKRFSMYFDPKGIEHLLAARETRRPIVLLTGHFGSFYSAEVAFSLLNVVVHPIVRIVDYSPVTPLARSLYEEINYRFTEFRSPVRYIYTDFSGKIDRSVLDIMNCGGTLLVCIDLPHRLYPYKHLPVTLFGQPATLPAGLIQWAVKKGALFLTAWNSVEFSDDRKFYRFLTVEPIPDSTDVTTVMQTYADRLTDRVSKQPWQWMGLPIITQYGENGGDGKNV